VSEVLTVAGAMSQARAQGVDRLDAQMLLSHVLGQGRAWLQAHDTDALPSEAAARYQSLTTRRAEGEPLAYLLGEKEFFGLNLRVSPAVLVPRPDTETLVSWALDVLAQHPADAPPPRVVDLGTGSGAIALAIKQHCPQAVVTAVEASPAALEIAQANAQALGLAVTFKQGSWFEPVAGQTFDLVVSNPPYIADADPHMPALRFEPRQALTSGVDGLDDIRVIVERATHHLVPGGWLLLEHGYDQPALVATCLNKHQFVNVSTRFDLAGHGRCTGGQTSKG
jgi:release factor glutamine methyltransferase